MVIIAEADLVNHRGVIFIYNRDNIICEQAAERMAGIQKTLTILEVAVCQQHLGNTEPVLAEKPLVQPHQAYLADCCCRLFQGNELWPVAEAKRSHSGCDCA